MNEHNTRSNKTRLSELFSKLNNLITTAVKPALFLMPNIDVKLIESLEDLDKFCILAEERLRMEYQFSEVTKTLVTKLEIALNDNHQFQQTMSNSNRKDQEQSEGTISEDHSV
ncbi:unnamed protein product [Didymodactylos carnosus]|uniref:Uncharacterized protein n=1 Tax=Didymodactylos carnosus TaxID=1234261 RepID=A0A813S5U6_9BILA|nr:unnamed protein product [Didymodactylos carnosus]CAF1535981.1 unnamed protein product [Didymodactylos carnosus]CAF3578878.1 unnamed protein product [Didymodactylos carnosus]CAF4323634.1 unnamed protein product [Didymodactylos carnosus]